MSPENQGGRDALSVQLRETARRMVAEDPLVSRRRLHEAGWPELLAEEPKTAVAALFETLGATLGTGDALDEVVLAALPDEAAPDTAVLHPVGTGAAVRPTGDGRFTLDGVLLRRTDEPARYLAPLAQADGTLTYALVDAAAGPAATAVSGMDAALGWRRVRGGIGADHLQVGRRGGEAWRTALTGLRRAQAHELIGLSGRMLAVAVEHAGTRRQFGRPIGSFQAVKHLLATVAVAIEAARSTTAESWTSGDPAITDLARAIASRGHAEAVRGGHQSLGAIGFTWEHEFHRYVRRGMALDALHGDGTVLRTEVGAAIAATGDVPRPDVLGRGTADADDPIGAALTGTGA